MQPIQRDEVVLRPVEDSDSPGIIALIGLCFSQYPGCDLHTNEEEAGLLTPESSFDVFWVLEARGRILGTIACGDEGTLEDGRKAVELKKLYMHPFLRGQGFATTLCDLVEQRARDLGRPIVELWTDTRFETAHRVYQHLGYVPTGRERSLHDRSDTREFHYVKEL